MLEEFLNQTVYLFWMMAAAFAYCTSYYFKKKEDLQSNFTSIGKDKEIIVYCGSGVTASPNYIALKEAGFKDVKIYIGSFSDWISYDDNPIE
jgi:thiosulfate/3-mercaptopyruvate sulfurtransferase